MDSPGSSKDPGQQFAFVLVNHRNDKENPISMRDVRAHAMREALRQKKFTKSGPERVDPLPYRTGRFRLKPPQSKTKKLRPRALLAARATNQATRLEDDEESASKKSIVASTSLTRMEPSALVDPFYTLPIKLGPRQQKLLYYYDRSFIQNSIAFNNHRRFMKIAAMDLSWLNATFSFVAQCYDLQSKGNQNLSTDYLYYRGQALRLVNENVSAAPTNISNTTLGAVATLCNFDIMSGNLPDAKAHMAGLVQIVRIRGGLHNICLTPDFLVRLLSWSDMVYASVFGGKPRFPLFELPIEFVNNVQFSKVEWLRPVSLIPINEIQHDLWETDQKLQMLSRKMQQENRSREDKDFLPFGIATTHHRLVSLLGILDEEKALPAHYFLLKANHMAALIYIMLTLREILPTAEMNQIMIQRLKSILEKAPSDLSSTCEQLRERLLWIAFIGGAAAQHLPERMFFVQLLNQIRESLMLPSLEQFQRILKAFAWLRTFSEPHSITLWSEMEYTTFSSLLGDSSKRLVSLDEP